MTVVCPPLLETFKERLLQLYGERLQGLYLYGSQARHTASDESDVDLLIVLDSVDVYYDEVARTSALTSEFSLDLDRSINCVFLPLESWTNGDTMFILNARKDAVPI